MRTDHSTRRVFLAGMLRATAAGAAVLLAYFLLPLDRLADVSVFIVLPVALVGFGAVITLEVRAILRATYPAARAVEALVRDVALFLVLFASTYFVMGTAHHEWFSERLSRLDAIYFAVTVFSTVGFGDITGTSPQARAAVTIQMAADLVVVGFGLRIIMGALQERRRRDGMTGPLLGGEPLPLEAD
jgi:voltage-gated potassium channel